MSSLGSFYTSSANIVYKIINYLGVLAGIACVAMIVFSLIKIMLSEDGEHAGYIKRIKNGLLALVLILTVTTTVSLIGKYFPANSVGKGIGSFTTSGSFGGNGDGISASLSPNVEYMSVDGVLYQKTKENTTFDCKSGWGNWSIGVDEWKLASDCQGATKGLFADVQYLYLRYNNYNTGWAKGHDVKFKGNIVSYSALEDARAYGWKDEAQCVSWLNSNSTSNYEMFDASNNPFDVTGSTPSLSEEEVQEAVNKIMEEQNYTVDWWAQ